MLFVLNKPRSVHFATDAPHLQQERLYGMLFCPVVSNTPIKTINLALCGSGI